MIDFAADPALWPASLTPDGVKPDGEYKAPLVGTG
jgi:hypothetical protein